jgi:hypothetical protein
MVQEVTVIIGGGKTVHAASYNQESREIDLYCNSLKYEHYFADITDFSPPTNDKVTCRKCKRDLLK